MFRNLYKRAKETNTWTIVFHERKRSEKNHLTQIKNSWQKSYDANESHFVICICHPLCWTNNNSSYKANHLASIKEKELTIHLAIAAITIAHDPTP